MSSVSMAGMGTGLDIYTMAEQMAMIQTSAKSEQLTQKETEISDEVAALEELSTAINSFYNTLGKYNDPDLFGALTVKMAEDDKEFVDATVNADALPNSYFVEVQQVAAQHKVQAFSGDAATATVPAGEYTLEVGGETMTIEVVDGQNSFGEVVDQINDHPDNPGVTASIVSDGTTSYLTLTSNETGEENAITMTKDGGAFSFEKELQKAQDAMFTVDGIPMTSPDNEVDDAIKGVTLDISKVTEEPIKIDIESDVDTMEESVDAIVGAYNDLLGTINKLTESSVDEDGNRVAAPLASDSMMSTLKNEMRTLLQMEFDEPFTSFASIGLTTDRDGSLEMDSEALTAALEEDPNAVTDMFMALTDGWQEMSTKYIGRPEEEEEDEEDAEAKTKSVSSSSDDYISADGIIDERIDALDEQQSRIDDEWTALEDRYQSIYQRYLDEYIAMDMAVAEMNNAMAYLIY